MLRWRRAVLLGLVSWLVPFLISFLLFPVKKLDSPLFGNMMAIVVLLTAGMLLRSYFWSRVVFVSEAVMIGFLWLAINLVLDYPMFAHGPMKMAAAQYYSEIGFAYLTFPAFAFVAALLVQSQRRPTRA